ncbi:MAG TPA: hypothetical protein VKB52_00345 [Rhodanobacteraceae bacterium]|nr:hypothetical protein [Rhodanobacteraceae bacterium]
MPIATAIPQAFEVIEAYGLDGVDYLVIPCADYDAWRATPAGLRFDDRTYARTGWNSDAGHAYYSTGRTFAVGTAHPTRY